MANDPVQPNAKEPAPPLKVCPDCGHGTVTDRMTCPVCPGGLLIDSKEAFGVVIDSEMGFILAAEQRRDRVTNHTKGT